MNCFRVAVLVAVILSMSSGSLAGEPTDQIRRTTDRILSIVTDPVMTKPEMEEERRARIREAVNARFDWEEMSQRALARHWSKRTDGEKKEFTRLFGRLLERTYLEKVEGYSGEKVLYGEEVTDEKYPGHAVVNVTIVTQKDTQIPVSYKVQKSEKGWLVYDIVIEGVSLVNNYRRQFAQMEYREIVQKLREKVGEK